MGKFPLLLLLVALGLFLLSQCRDQLQERLSYVEPPRVAFSELYERRNEVESIAVDGRVMRGKWKNKDERFSTVADPEYADVLIAELIRSGIKVEFKEKSEFNVVELAKALALPAVLLLLFLLYMKGMGKQFSAIAGWLAPKARLIQPEKVATRLEDVAGLMEAKIEALEVVEFLKNPKRFKDVGAQIPKGILFIGKPGTGKTLLARAIAGEAKVPFFSTSGSSFVEMFVGVGASRIRKVFEDAKEMAPAIIFIDEFDAVARTRGAGLGSGHDEREQTLNQLLVEMDGFDTTKGVVLIAATNRPDILDPAVVRPGRFDRQITFEIPNIQERREILQVHMRGKPLADDVDIEVIAEETSGFSGADLANLVNEAAILAVRESLRLQNGQTNGSLLQRLGLFWRNGNGQQIKITMQHFDEAWMKVTAGSVKRSKILSPEEKRIIAYHEAGHALLAQVSLAEPLNVVSTLPRVHGSLGLTSVLPEERSLHTLHYLSDKMVYYLGGRAAEELVFGEDEITNGATNDLEKVSNLARKVVAEWGMDKKFGLVTFLVQKEIFLGKELGHMRVYSERTAEEIDTVVKELVHKLYEEAKSILAKHRNVLDAFVEELLAREEIKGEEEIDAAFKRAGLIMEQK